MKNVPWGVVLARIKFWLWQIATKGVLGIIYVAVISDGLRQVVPVLGQKLYKLPGLGLLQRYEATYRLDLAPLLSVFILVGVFYLWGHLLAKWLRPDDPIDGEGWDEEKQEMVILVLGMALLGADALLFYVSMSRVGWSGGGLSFTAALATAAYLAVLIFVSYVSLVLKCQLETEKENAQ